MQVDHFKVHARRRLERMRSVFPASEVAEGRSGPWAVDRFDVTERDVEIAAIRATAMRSRGYTPPGRYTRLVRDGTGVFMSDTLDEMEDAHSFVTNASGRVLVSGLGLGLVLHALAARPSVESVTVVERDEDVVRLVGNGLPGAKVDVVVADILTWRPPTGARWESAFHDIWAEISPENVPEMRAIRDRYRRRVAVQHFWAGEDLYPICRERFLLGTERRFRPDPSPVRLRTDLHETDDPDPSPGPTP